MSDMFKLDRIQWNWSGWNEVRKSPGVQSLLMEGASRIAGNAGAGYKAVQYPTRVIVVPDTEEAERENLKNNTLLKARR